MKTQFPCKQKINTMLLLGAVTILNPVNSMAAEPEQIALVPLPSVFDFTNGQGWGAALGAGLEYESAYDGSDEYEIEVNPVGAVHWRRGNNLFFFEGYELGWRGRVAQQCLLQTGLRYESGLEADDSDDGQLDGLPERDNHVVGFIETRYALDPEWQKWLGFRLMGGESDFGVLGVVAAGYRPTQRSDGLGFEFLLFSTFGDAAFINKDFGVSASDSAASGLSETSLDGGYRSTGITMLYRETLWNRLQYAVEIGIEYYNNDIADSPIAQERYETETGVNLLWVF